MNAAIPSFVRSNEESLKPVANISKKKMAFVISKSSHIQHTIFPIPRDDKFAIRSVFLYETCRVMHYGNL